MYRPGALTNTTWKSFYTTSDIIKPTLLCSLNQQPSPPSRYYKPHDVSFKSGIVGGEHFPVVFTGATLKLNPFVSLFSMLCKLWERLNSFLVDDHLHTLQRLFSSFSYFGKITGPRLNIKTVFPSLSIIKIDDRKTVFIMGIPLLARRLLYIETAPGSMSIAFMDFFTCVTSVCH